MSFLLAGFSSVLKYRLEGSSLPRAGLSEQELSQWESFYKAGREAEKKGEWEEAIRWILKASAIDDHFAELHFLLGRCYWEEGQRDQARQRFELARDWDALQLRADGRINGLIRHTARDISGPKLHLVDSAQFFSGTAPGTYGIPGDNFFYEYVHFRFEGDYQMARALYPAAVSALSRGEAVAADEPPAREFCERALAYNVIHELQMTEAILRLTGKPPFLDQWEHTQRQETMTRNYQQRAEALTRKELDRALQSSRAAIAQSPGDWWLYYNYGMLCQTAQDYPASVTQLERAVALMPHVASLRLALADALARARQTAAARQQIREALRIDPQFTQARQAWAELEAPAPLAPGKSQ